MMARVPPPGDASPMYQLEETLQKKYFSGITFVDERERAVFLSFIRGFSLLTWDSSVRNILEIGGGQSTTLLATLGKRVGWNVVTIDMNPDAIALKVRSQTVSEATHENIRFRKGFSLNVQEVHAYYSGHERRVGRVSFADAVKAAAGFIETTMDARKAPRVARALGLLEFSAEAVVDALLRSDRLPAELLDVFRTPGDEFEFDAGNADQPPGCLRQVLDAENIDAVFLDSGEFSSVPEWAVVAERLRPGGYVVLHDIFFPKSFKNWIVCGSILADPGYETLYVDRSTPQGFMVAQKKRA